MQRATGLRVDGQYRFIQLADGREMSSHCVLLAPGVQYRKLEIPGADRLTGRGIYYGAALVEALPARTKTSLSSAAPIPPARPPCTLPNMPLK